MLSHRIEASLDAVVKRWENKDKESLWPLFQEIATGRVTELFGITSEPTLHRIRVDGGELFTCCALVAHTAPAIFGKPVTIVSTDPLTDRDITIRISEELQLQDVDPQASYASLVDCETHELIADPRTKFCGHVKHFNSAESGADFCRQDSRRYLVEIEDFHTAAQKLFHRIWGSQAPR